MQQPTKPWDTSVEICEALVRHVELSGSEVFEKTFVQNGRVRCVVWCMIGDNAEPFNEMVKAWLEKNGFKLDY